MKTMKDSGIAWIGEIPVEWSSTPLFSIFCEHKEKNKKGQENNVLSLSYGEIIKRNIDNNKGLLPESFNTYNIVDAGDIILRLTDLQNDKTSLRAGLVTQKGIITSAYLALRAKSKQHSKYYHYLLHTYDMIKVLYNMGDGVRQNLKFSELSKMPLLIFDFSIQQAIANYLDDKCSKIDSTIEKEKQHIEKLKEYRKSVITEAVTKGLDPSTPMKNSGVEWIGDIPQGWEVHRIKNITTKVGSGKTPLGGSEIYIDDGIIFLRSQNIYNNGLKLDNVVCISELTHNEMRASKVQYNDILLNITGGSIGRCCIYPLAYQANVNQHVCIIRINRNNNSKYLCFFWQSASGQESINIFQEGANREGLNFEQIENTRFPLPPIPTQQAIADYLDTKTAQIDHALSKKETLIEKLQEYKKSLIFEAVTGKIEL